MSDLKHLSVEQLIKRRGECCHEIERLTRNTQNRVAGLSERVTWIDKYIEEKSSPYSTGDSSMDEDEMWTMGIDHNENPGTTHQSKIELYGQVESEVRALRESIINFLNSGEAE